MVDNKRGTAAIGLRAASEARDASAELHRPADEALFRAFLAASSLPMGLLRPSGDGLVFLGATQALAAIIGRSELPQCGQSACAAGLEAATAALWTQCVAQCLRTGQAVEGECSLQVSGEERWFHCAFNPLADAVAVVAVDITAHKKAASQADLLNRVLRTTSEINQLIVREADADHMLAEACRILAGLEEIRAVFVRLDDRQTGMLVPVAQAGLASDAITAASARHDNGPLAQGPSGLAVRTGQRVVVPDLLADPDCSPWWETIRASDHNTAAAFPMRLRGEVVGVLTAYGKSINAFSPEVVACLEELTNDLAFARQSIAEAEARREAEATMRASEERYRSLFENSLDAVLLTAPDGTAFAANPAAELLFGYSEAEICRLGRKGLVDEDDPRLGPALAQRALTGQAKVELAFRRKDGSRFEAEVTSSVFHDGSGEARTAMFISDISERAAAAADLRESEERFRLAATASNNAIWDWDLTTNAVRRMEGYRSLFGYDPAELDLERGANWPLLHPEDVARVQRCQAEALAGAANRWAVEYRLRRADGSYAFVLDRACIIRDEAGQPVRMVGAKIDLTERKAADEALRESEERYRRLVEGSPDAIFINQEGRFAYLNSATATLLGYDDPRELLGRPVLDIVYPRSRAVVAQRVERLLAEGGASVPSAQEYVRRDGSAVQVEALAFRSTFDGRPAVQSIVRDISERLRAEEALRESERALAALLGNLPGVAYRCLNDPDWTMKFISEGCLTLTGYSPQELISGSDVSLGHLMAEEDRGRVWETVQQAVRARRPYELEYRLRAKSGEWRWVWERGSGVWDEDGNLLALEGFVGDISERKAADEALRESEERFRLLFEVSPEAITVHDGRVNLMANQAAANILGATSPADLIGRPITDTTDPQAMALLAERVERLMAIEAAQLPPVELKLRRLDGTPIYAETKATTIDYHGHRAFLVAFRNTTARRRAEEALRESEERFRLAATASNNAIWDWDLTTNTVRRMEGYHTLFGYDPEEVASNQDAIWPLLHPEDVPHVRQSLEAARTGTSNNWAVEYRFRRADGSYAFVLDRAFIIRDEAFRPVRMVGAMIDLTERKAAEEGLRLAVGRLNRALEGTIQAVTQTVEMRDPYTAGHQKRVTTLAAAIGREMGLSNKRLQGLRLAAAVHDLGKIAIPTEILSKPGRLSATEMSLIRTHPDVGYEILRPIDFPWPVADLVHQHQERMDGSGYPQGLRGDEIMLEARILAVADVVEAMASHRPYRPALGVEAALAEIEGGAGRLYDPAVVQACTHLLREGGFTLD